jgi:ComF family protein
MEGNICGECMANPPQFDKARACFAYDENSKNMIAALKYNDKLHLVSYLGMMLKRASDEFKGQYDMIIPVPLHYQRLVKRRFNQAALLARQIAKGGKAPVELSVLERARNTSPQFGLNRAERARNVEKAFSINDGNSSRLAGKNILLIDDVLTTGATANACAKVLKKSGAEKVFIATLARTPLD